MTVFCPIFSFLTAVCTRVLCKHCGFQSGQWQNNRMSNQWLWRKHWLTPQQQWQNQCKITITFWNCVCLCGGLSRYSGNTRQAVRIKEITGECSIYLFLQYILHLDYRSENLRFHVFFCFCFLTNFKKSTKYPVFSWSRNWVLFCPLVVSMFHLSKRLFPEQFPEIFFKPLLFSS